MSAITAILLGGMSILAPVPQERLPDPTARGYVGVSLSNSGVAIDRVEPNTPAERAGLRAGDVLLRIGAVQARTTDQVIAHICSFRPGAIVEIEVQRGSERKTFKVKLGIRPIELDTPRYYPDDVIPPPDR